MIRNQNKSMMDNFLTGYYLIKADFLEIKIKEEVFI